MLNRILFSMIAAAFTLSVASAETQKADAPKDNQKDVQTTTGEKAPGKTEQEKADAPKTEKTPS